MTLAAILVFSVVFASPAQPVEAGGQTATQAASTAKPDSTLTPAQEQATTPPAQSPAPSQPAAPTSTPTQKSSGQVPPKTAPRHHPRKRVTAAELHPRLGGRWSNRFGTRRDRSPDKKRSNSLPTPKIVVRQGGTSEPSIQLAGGTSGNRTSSERDTANQMLDATRREPEKNRGHATHNEPAGHGQPNPPVHGPVESSRHLGDLDRARTLAWKAQLLSEELVKPKE